MIPTEQTILHAPDDGRFGNCLSAVLASLLHLPIEQIPSFTAPGPQWQRDLNRWLRQFGLAYVQVSAFDAWAADTGIEGCWHEIGGTTPRFADVEHAMVGTDGRPVFDPHPSDAGVEAITAHGIFIALRPWELVRTEAREISEVAS